MSLPARSCVNGSATCMDLVAFELDLGRDHLCDRAADMTGLRIPTDVISHFETLRCHRLYPFARPDREEPSACRTAYRWLDRKVPPHDRRNTLLLVSALLECSSAKPAQSCSLD